MRKDVGTGIIDAGAEGIGISAPWLRHRLDALGISLNAQARLTVALNKLEEMRVKAANGDVFRFKSVLDAQRWYIDAVGVDFLSKAIHAGEEAGLKDFKEHYSYLAGGDPVLTGSATGSSQRNKTWELLLASLVATFADRVRPEEPDVVCEFKGRQVGLAAKVLYSADEWKHLTRLKEGAKQLQNSDSELGFVVANLVEQFPHKRMIENFKSGNVKTNGDATRIVDVWFESFIEQYDLRTWGRRFTGMEKLVGILFFLPTVLHMSGVQNPLTPYFTMHPVWLDGREHLGADFHRALNRVCYETLSFRPAEIGAPA